MLSNREGFSVRMAIPLREPAPVPRYRLIREEAVRLRAEERSVRAIASVLGEARATVVRALED